LLAKIDGFLWKWISCFLNGICAHQCKAVGEVVSKLFSNCIKRTDGLVRDLWSDAISRDDYNMFVGAHCCLFFFKVLNGQGMEVRVLHFLDGVCQLQKLVIQKVDIVPVEFMSQILETIGQGRSSAPCGQHNF